MPTIRDPRCCGFMKVAIYEISLSNQLKGKNHSNKVKSQALKQNFETFSKTFSTCDGIVDVKYEWYRQNEKFAKTLMQDVNRQSTETKQRIKDTFGLDSWNKVNDLEKVNHSLFECGICKKKYKSTLSLLCIYSAHDKVLPQIAFKAGLHKKEVIPEAKISQATNETVEKLNVEFEDKFGKSFESEFERLKGLKDKKAEDKLSKQIIKNIENSWKETSVLRFVMYYIPY